MGKGRPRAVEKGVVGQNLSLAASSSSGGSLHVPTAPVYYPNEEEFKDPLEYISKIRAEAEEYGICKIVPPKGWSPPFALNLNDFSFPTKTQAIHQLQARNASCDPKTFELEYNRFLENHGGKKLKKKVVFEGEELDLCKLFNAVKRFGGYNKVVKKKKWGDVSRFVKSGKKVSDCAKHVLCQLYREHLYDYEEFYNRMNKEVSRNRKRGVRDVVRKEEEAEVSCSKRRRKYGDVEKIKVCKKEEEHDQICEQCKSGLHGEVMLLCDRCNKGWHIYCLSPPLKQIPPGNWYCFECLNSDKDSFGFVPGKQYTVEAFRRMADRCKRKWFGSGSASRVQIEKKFWDIVEGFAGEVEVMYGSDLDTSVYGSGFPRVNDQRPEMIEANVWDEYSRSPWNLNNLPKLKGSMLQAVHHNITGVMVPWLYLGMLFSSFCWHFEDHCFYSMNYLHWGEPKCWYSVPGGDADAFEKVMRNSLPDLFESQPDLLFQLVTMLNPSVLQENGVPVYTIQQEPGNFVITFPRSYHGGFNFGLNCAEAVNFAPADWLPHGGFGAQLYKMYHKAPVISHEELLCVVAKGGCDSEASPHLRKELLRVYSKEKTWRERLWRSGVVRSSPLPPRKFPEYVGTEEDHTCIICKQYLHLSAVKCRCRPSDFVCLEHWKHICECKPSRLRLLYRHTLAELCDLVLRLDGCSSEGRRESNELRKQISCSNDQNGLTKKVKGVIVSLNQLAEQWLECSSKIFQDPYSGDAYATLLKEAEQFLWAGSEMDLIRDITKKMTVAQKWAEGIRECLSKIQNWSCRQSNDVERVRMDVIIEFLNFDPVPCNEPGHLKLKEHAEEAKLLIQEVSSVLSSFSKISELESWHSRASNFPIYLTESENLSQKISSAKVWMDSARKCILEKCPATVDVDTLYKLKSEMEELQVEFPEAETVLELLSQAETCRARCCEILKAPMILKDVEVVLQDLDNFTVNIPEMMLLKQYYTDAVFWSTRRNTILMNVHEREDQDNVVNELNCLLKDGALLRIQVDELPLLEAELKKACCREKALKARDTKMPMDFIQKLMMEAAVLKIEREKLFIDLSGALTAAVCWEERATEVITHEAQMSDFESVIRISENIPVILPSLSLVKDAVLMAKSWLENSKDFLESSSSVALGSCCLLKLESLKELVLQSKLLKISLKEREILEKVLKNCDDWQQLACSSLQDIESLLTTSDTANGKENGLLSKIENLITRAESDIKAGLSLGFDFPEIPKLQNACSVLQWCARVLYLCSSAPSSEDVESLMDTAENQFITCVSGILWSSLLNGVKWLRKALRVISVRSDSERCMLKDAEEVLAESEVNSISFPVIIGELQNAIQKHKCWQEQVDQFYSLNSGERSWSVILELKYWGRAIAFGCSTLDMVLSETEKVEKWKQRCMDIVGRSVDDRNPLLGALQKVKHTLDISLYIYGKLDGGKARNSCICPSICTEDQELVTCLTCKNCYHLRCLEPAIGDANISEPYICPYCLFVEHGLKSQSGVHLLKSRGTRPELRMLIDLLSDAEDFSVMIEERDVLQEVVEQALECKMCLRDILDFVLSCFDTDRSVVSEKLTVALKATKVAGVYDEQDSCDLDLALARNWWRARVNRLLEDSQKPTMQMIQQHLKEGLHINIPPEDYCRQRLTELKHIGIQWANHAKKVATDSGALSLDKVFELISEGEKLPVHLGRELQLLRARSMLYCICRKPYDDRPKVFCDQCDEWYHVECLKFQRAPKTYVCAACNSGTEQLSVATMTDDERVTSANSVEPKTPSPLHSKLRMKSDDIEYNVTRTMLPIENHSTKMFSRSSGIDQLWWRSRKPFRRAAKRRTAMESLSLFFHIQ